MLRPYTCWDPRRAPTLRRLDLPPQRQDLLANRSLLLEQPEERPSAEHEQPERPGSTDDAIEPLEKDQRRVPRERQDDRRRQRRVHAEPQPDDGDPRQPGERKEHHRRKHLGGG